jgi:hypothetical protein
MPRENYKFKQVDGVKIELTSEEIDTLVAEEEAHAAVLVEKAKTKYRRDRRKAYAPIGDQLDMLFHDMTAGKCDKTGDWYAAIAKVKLDNPKP